MFLKFGSPLASVFSTEAMAMASLLQPLRRETWV